MTTLKEEAEVLLDFLLSYEESDASIVLHIVHQQNTKHIQLDKQQWSEARDGKANKRGRYGNVTKERSQTMPLLRQSGFFGGGQS